VLNPAVADPGGSGSRPISPTRPCWLPRGRIRGLPAWLGTLPTLRVRSHWSYQLLSPLEQRVFRFVSVFPGPFTLGAAEAVAGADAEMAVLRLVDCSLLVSPRTGPDGRSRYTRLGTLRSFGIGRLHQLGVITRSFMKTALAVLALAAMEGCATRTPTAPVPPPLRTRRAVGAALCGLPRGG
jgi:hypothetical protein